MDFDNTDKFNRTDKSKTSGSFKTTGSSVCTGNPEGTASFENATTFNGNQETSAAAATTKSSAKPSTEPPSFDSPEVLARLKNGDDELFAAMVGCYQHSLLALARNIIGHSLADEVVQESWLMAYKALPKFEGRSKLKTWLFTIVSNHSKTRLRKESRTVSLEGQNHSADNLDQRFAANGHWASPINAWHIDSPEGLLQEKQLRHCIEHTLALLPQSQKQVFTLREFEQMSLTEICNTTGAGESNVRVLLHRARMRLYQVIERYQETGKC